MRMRVAVVSAALLVAASVILVAQTVEYSGKVVTIEKTRLQIEQNSGARPRQVWLSIGDDTPVVEGDKTMTVATAKLKKNVTLTAIVRPLLEAPPKEWSCTMHTHVAEAGPGKCPVCGMALVEREKAPAVKELRVTKR